MWKKEISVEEACELHEEAIHSENVGDSRWTVVYEHIVKCDESPTGLAGFELAEPRSFEQQGIMDVNYGPIEMYPVEEKEIVIKSYVKIQNS